MKRVLLSLAIILITLSAKAQDPHFTQFFASPLTLNPAFTGYFSGDFRLSGNYRSQWSSVTSPYVTGTVAADFGIMKDRISYNDIWGVGILAMYDKTGSGALTTTYAALSTAYHKALDVDGNHTLGLGVQMALVNKRIDQTKLIFENQIGNTGFDPSLPSGESIANPSIGYMDYNVGLLYNGLIGEDANAYLGASYYHFTQPIESFLGQNNNRLSYRYTVHAGGSFPISEYNRIHLSAYHMRQNQATETALGGAIGFLVNGIPEEPTTFYVGAWYRYKDAVNPYVGLEFKNVQVGLSYDFNVSTLRAASNYRGGMELSIIYIHRRDENSRYRQHCPRF
ncbi:type IX secretion system PorP/SprF family membrane protein [Chitinophaga skermanii]|uniref:Type IX secretion system PorP/SprF family membrane protein n=1 Tax=Chitinophaga skermanii TaxID=331697 RepID=A0A327R1V2_9BACT|nr:PorP/SprF family type IX secretion system membrane protein [Chitinophaga skermanii]RAJ10621.1 type IX secretion system PorP/SprF family membrane protein [Chitinophaga skermanii]